jgi:hypothetical protein
MPPEPIPTMTRSYRSATVILLAARAEPMTCSFVVDAVDEGRPWRPPSPRIAVIRANGL